MWLKAAEQFIDTGDFRRAADTLGASASDQTSRTLLAWAYLECGETAEALKLAGQLLRQPLTPSNHARCLAVSGRAQARLGRIAEGLALLKRAVVMAASHGAFLEAEVRAQYVSAALNWHGVEPALAELPGLRRAALESANRGALTEYHIAYARVAALRGWRDKTQAELTAARNLLDSFQHLAMSWRLQQSLASISILAGELEAAIAHGEAGLNLATEIGSKSKRASTLANLAYIWSAAGDFTRAAKLLDESHTLLEAGSQVRLATLGTGVYVGIRTDQEDLALSMLREGEALTTALPEDTYYRVCFALQQVYWNVQHGEYEQALAIADHAMQSIDRVADLDLADRMKLLRIEALSLGGKRTQALAAYSELPRKGAQFTLEVVAELERVNAVICRETDRSTSVLTLSAAARVLSASGLLGTLRDVERTAARLKLEILPTDELQGSGLHASSVTRHLALILRLGKYPRALANELFAFIQMCGVAEFGVLLEKNESRSTEIGRFDRSGSGCKHELEGPCDEIPVSGNPGSFLIRVKPVDAVTFASFRLAIVQIVEAALACRDAGIGIEPPSPWPFETVEQRDGMIVSAGSTTELLGTTKRIAPSNITVLITGETGTGKELFARALHDSSPRSAKPFIPFNCSAVSREMLDAQLFGYRKGAFTGAADAFPGVIRAAAGGTLFLDEIGEVALDVQPKLLRFLESGEIHPLGEPRPIAVDVRVVAATNADLEHLVDDGRFREDLFYRLNVVRLHVPPLRERREEIPPLVQHYLEKCSRESQKTGIRVADETMEYLILYKWPGNVRQLANEVRRMVALAEAGAVLMPEHLSQEIAASRRTIAATDRYIAPTEFVVRMDQPMSAAMEHLERSMIQYALRLSGGRVEDAAERLGLSRKGLYLKRQRLAMQDAAAEQQSVLPA